MSNIKKKFCTVLVALFAILMILGICLSLPTEVSAATTYFPDEKYTEDDHLLQSNGELSSRMIGDFAVDVKKSLEGQSFPELAQVVPLEYLETTEETAEFAYNGKEYGFYIAKEENYFDILLIDFIYEFDDVGHTNNEYKIRIEPILQQRLSVGKDCKSL